MAIDWSSLLNGVAEAVTNGVDFINNNNGGYPVAGPDVPPPVTTVQPPPTWPTVRNGTADSVDPRFYTRTDVTPDQGYFSQPNDIFTQSQENDLHKYDSYYGQGANNGSAWDRIWQGLRPEKEQYPPKPYSDYEPYTQTGTYKIDKAYQDVRAKQDAWDDIFHGLPSGESM